MVIETTWLRWIVALPALGVLFNVFVGRRATGAVKLVGPGVVGAAFALAVSAALRRAAAPAAANPPAGFGETAALARQLFTVYLLPFELTSLLLLVAIVGAVALAKK